MNAWAYPTHHAKRQFDRCTQFHTTTQQSPHWLQWDAANSPRNCPFPFDDHHQNLIHPYRARPHSPPQTASRSNQPFCHCSHVRTNTYMGQANVPYHERFALWSDALIIISGYSCKPVANPMCWSVCLSVCPEGVLWQNG